MKAAAEERYNTYVQTIYNDGNGLPGGKANDIAQTKDGILWVGTYGGLYRYNGSRFRWMNEYESVKNVNAFIRMRQEDSGSEQMTVVFRSALMKKFPML